MRSALAGRKRGLALLSLAVAIAAAAPAAVAGAGPNGRAREFASTSDQSTGSSAAPDSTAAPPERPPRAEPGGPDVRSVRGGGVADLLDPRPLARYEGTGRPGHRASLGRGVLPTAMSAVAVAGRRTGDRLTCGLDILSAWVLSDGTLVVPTGPDLSLLPVRTASALDGPVDVLARGLAPHLAAVVVTPGRVPGPTPWARLTIGRGDSDWTTTAVEFGRRYRDGAFGLSGFLERQDGNAPTPGDSHEIEHLGGRTLFEVGSRWRAEITALRSRLDRSVPVGSAAVGTDWIRSDVRLVVSRERSRFEVFHTDAWISSGIAGGSPRSATTASDGLSASIGIERPPVDAVLLEVSRHASDGSLLAGDERSMRVATLVTGRFALGGGSLAVSAGGDWLGGRAVPAAAATLSGGAHRAAWSVCAEVGGRQPTAIERLVAPRDVPGRGSPRLSVEGNDELEPEIAVVLSADYARLDLLSGVGIRGELARIVEPVVLGEGSGAGARPVNGDDETAGAASLWAAIGDSSSAGARSTIDVFWTDDDGAVSSLAPVPRASLAASAWATSRFFEGGFLAVRWECALRHEVGLGRGPWDGHVEDAVTSVDAAASAQAGPVRMFLEVRDLLDGRGERLPGRPSGGRRIAAGFSSSFWN